jgi:tetratricopeptide (TPR) repeat protein
VTDARCTVRSGVGLLACLVALFALGPSARAIETIRPWAATRLERARAALAKGDSAACHAALAELEHDAGRLTDYERALTWQLAGSAQASEEHYADAATSFERSLASGGLPEAVQNDVRYDLAQVYVLLERYADAAETLRVWFAAVEKPPPAAHYLLAMTYMQMDDHARALPHARAAVQQTDAPQESWLQLLLALLVDDGRYHEALPVAERLVERFPKKSVWLQLSAVHARLDQRREALGALEAAYDQGMLTQSDEIVRLVQLYLYAGVPYRGAAVLEKALRAGAVAPSATTWELLANAWLQARERERALVPLANAARLADTGEVYVRLAQLQLDRQQWNDARASLAAAIRKGGLGDPGRTQLLLGIANASEGRWDAARAAFTAAQGYPATKSAATEWLASVNREQELRTEEAEPTH